jgi:1,4-alpha-glucan branching enzyme
VRATCVELTSRFGLGAREHLQPFVCEAGVTLVPIDRASMNLVWSDGGYPANGSYRDYHKHTIHHHNPWGNDGEAYDHERARALAQEHAADFVGRTRERLRRDGGGLPGGGLAVCALDTELLGHWWYEGITWLGAVVEECSRQGLELVRLDDVLDRSEPVISVERGAQGGREGERCEVNSWGAEGDLSTWSGPEVAELAFATRAAELETLTAVTAGRAGPAAVRELLALQASDWPFMISRGLAVPYAHERFGGHRAALQDALAVGPEADRAGLRNLAAHADPSLLLSP